jgi:hypothetical protein
VLRCSHRFGVVPEPREKGQNMDIMTVLPLDGWHGFVSVSCGNVTATLTVAEAERIAADYLARGGEVLAVRFGR